MLFVNDKISDELFLFRQEGIAKALVDLYKG